VLLRVITGNWLGDEKTVLVSALSLVLRKLSLHFSCIHLLSCILPVSILPHMSIQR
jgi:hypothetical protein